MVYSMRVEHVIHLAEHFTWMDSSRIQMEKAAETATLIKLFKFFPLILAAYIYSSFPILKGNGSVNRYASKLVTFSLCNTNEKNK